MTDVSQIWRPINDVCMISNVVFRSDHSPQCTIAALFFYDSATNSSTSQKQRIYRGTSACFTIRSHESVYDLNKQSSPTQATTLCNYRFASPTLSACHHKFAALSVSSFFTYCIISLDTTPHSQPLLQLKLGQTHSRSWSRRRSTGSRVTNLCKVQIKRPA